MKKMKITLTLFAVLVLLAFTGNAFAAGVQAVSTDVTYTIGTTKTTTVGLSPKVVAQYATTTDASATKPAQWYAIAAGHQGGNAVYATAQDLNNIYTKTFVTGTAVDSTLFALFTDPTSVSAWKNAGWATK